MADIKILLVSSATCVEDVKNELKLCYHYMPTLLCIHSLEQQCSAHADRCKSFVDTHFLFVETKFVAWKTQTSFELFAMHYCTLFNNFSKCQLPHHVVIDRHSSTYILNEDIRYKTRKIKLHDFQAVCSWIPWKCLFRILKGERKYLI